MKYIAHLANAFSALRIVLTPVCIWLLFQHTQWAIIAAIIVFTLAALSDSFDGYFARKLNIVSELGNFLDPMADKILILGTFGAFWYLHLIPLWFVIVLISRDIIVTHLRTELLRRGTSLKTSDLGKWKTFFQFILAYVVFFYLLITHMQTNNLSMIMITGKTIAAMVYAIAAMTIYTGIDYLIQSRAFLVAMIIEINATFCYFGYVPYAPGSVASIITAVVVFFLPTLPLLFYMALLVALFCVGVFVSGRYEQAVGKKDPSAVVIDEVVGMAIGLILVPKDPLLYVVALVAFRIFDIFKLYPACAIDKKISGGFGILLDDVVAGLYALGVVHTIAWLMR